MSTVQRCGNDNTFNTNAFDLLESFNALKYCVACNASHYIVLRKGDTGIFVWYPIRFLQYISIANDFEHAYP